MVDDSRSPVPPSSRWQVLFDELKRRKVFRAAALYGAAAFVALQVVDIVAEGLAFPPVVLRAVTVAVLAGFPVVLLLAWTFEMQPGVGLRRTRPPSARVRGSGVPEPRHRSWLAGLLALGGTALLLFGAWLVGGSYLGGGRGPSLSRPELAAGSAGGTVVAVLPFSVRGSPGLQYLGDGMVSLLGTKLDGAGDLRTLDSRAVRQLVDREGLEPGDPSAGRRVAESFGADLYLVGDIVEVGGRMQLTAALYDTRRPGAPAGEGAVEGVEASMFDMVDALTAQLLSGLSGGPAARVSRIAAVTTGNLPALKAFLEGEEAYRRGQFDHSVESFQRAVAEDTTFALAYYRLSVAANWSLRDELSRITAEQTVRYADRLAERDRRMVEAHVILRRGENLRAAEAYRRILGMYPDEMEAWLELAETQFHTYPLYGRSFTEARASLEQVLKFDPDHSTVLIHLGRIAAYEGDMAELDTLVHRFYALDPDPGRTLATTALHAFATGDRERRAEVEDRLAGGDDVGVALAVWEASVFGRNVEGGETVARALTAPTRGPEVRRLGHVWRAYLAVARGRWAEAREALSSLARLSPGRALAHEAILSNVPLVPVSDAELSALAGRLERLDPAAVEPGEHPSSIISALDYEPRVIRSCQLGLLRARLGDTAAALRRADTLDAMGLPGSAGSIASDLARSVLAAARIPAGRLEEALAELEAARMDTWYGYTMSSPLFAHAHDRYTRAELLFELPYHAPALLRLGEIAEARGDARAAARHYRTFLALWAQADPELRDVVDEVRGRLDRLPQGADGMP